MNYFKLSDLPIYYIILDQAELSLMHYVQFNISNNISIDLSDYILLSPFNTLSNTVFQTGSVENYMRAQGAGNFAGNRNKIINGVVTGTYGCSTSF